jgi:hypothetical protein
VDFRVPTVATHEIPTVYLRDVFGVTDERVAPPFTNGDSCNDQVTSKSAVAGFV